MDFQSSDIQKIIKNNHLPEIDKFKLNIPESNCKEKL